MGAYRGPAHKDFDPKRQYQRPKGTGSIEMTQRADGRYRVSVPPADGKGRRYGYIRGRRKDDEYNARIWELLQA
jgi:hypothetical protein